MEEINTNIEKNEVENNYIEQIKSLKENSVNKSDYNKLVEENKQLVESLINGSNAIQTKGENSFDTKTLAQNLVNEHTNNLDFWKSALNLRETILANSGGERDIFTFDNKVNPNSDDIEKQKQTAEKVADVINQCIVSANGNSRDFCYELQKRIRQ